MTLTVRLTGCRFFVVEEKRSITGLLYLNIKNGLVCKAESDF